MKLISLSSPHIRDKITTGRIMGDVIIALLPALAAGVWQFGWMALWLAAVCAAAAVGAEWLWCALSNRPLTINDGSALVTGVLLAMTLPPSAPLWLAGLGGAAAVVLPKLFCGGLGQNPFNPALTARALLVLLFPLQMVRYETADAVTSATPLHEMAIGGLPQQSVWSLFVGSCPGSAGEISALAILLGGAYLVWRRVISLRIPLAYLGTVAVLTLLFPRAGTAVEWMLCQLLSGGLMLAAFFMATDYSSSPVTPNGRLLYGVGCGALTVLFRYVGIFPEGVTYAVLLMNAAAWTIDRYTAPRRFGVQKGGRT